MRRLSRPLKIHHRPESKRQTVNRVTTALRKGSGTGIKVGARMAQKVNVGAGPGPDLNNRDRNPALHSKVPGSPASNTLENKETKESKHFSEKKPIPGKLFKMEEVVEIRIPSMVYQIVSLRDGRQVWLTENFIQLGKIQNNEFQISHSYACHQASSIQEINNEQILVHTALDNIVILNLTNLEEEYCLGGAIGTAISPEGRIFILKPDIKQDWLEVWNLASAEAVEARIALVKSKNWLVIPEGLLSFHKNEMELWRYDSSTKTFSCTSKLLAPNLTIEKHPVYLENGFFRVFLCESNRVHIWDSRRGEHFLLPFYNNQMKFLESMPDEMTFLVGIDNGERLNEFYFYHSGTQLAYPAGLSGMRFFSAFLLVDGNLQFCIKSPDNTHSMHQFRLPYLMDLSQKIQRQLLDVTPLVTTIEIGEHLGFGMFKNKNAAITTEIKQEIGQQLRHA